MAGVGKTTMAKEVAERAKGNKLFDEVVTVMVGKKPNLSKIQASIADMLGLKLGDKESLIVGAPLLHQRLLQDNKKILVILDDIRVEFALDAIGIPLREDEAWQLFRENAGDLADAPDLRPIAKQIVNKCGGLPLDMLDRLSCTSNTPAHGHLSSSLELGYNYVEDEEGKRLFLLCCLFEDGKSILIEDLARYALGLSLLDGISEMRKARDRVFALVDDLKSRYLLLDGENDKCVKVHDIVRDMGISIASKVKGMEKLKVLELINYDGILTLQSLRNLRTLSLQGFGGMLDNVSVIGDLLNLEILSFQGSSIDELPEEIGELVNLRLLDLDNTWSLNRIPPGVISRLLRLEELYIFHSKFRDWEGKGNKKEGRNANLREFLSLSNLNTLEICITCDVFIPKVPIFSKLTTYKVLIGDKGGHSRCIDQYKRQLIVTAWTWFLSNRGGINSLLGGSDCLILIGKGCNDLVRELLLLSDWVDRSQQLRHLEIHDCDTPEYVADKMYMVQLPAAPSPVVFPILEELKLSALPNLREICHGPLKELEVEDCGSLRNMFHFSMAGGLVNLQKLIIRNCLEMEVVVGGEEEIEDGQGKADPYAKGGRFSASGDISSASGISGSQSQFSFSASEDTCIDGEILPTSNLKAYSFGDLKSATGNFRNSTVLGQGGFGTVYKGFVDEKTLAPTKFGSGMIVAIKKLNLESIQGFQEWQSEVNFLGRLCHPNLVILLGYCLEDQELLLVYEFMERGSLENHLFGRVSSIEPLSWDIRLKIAIDAAKGLAFLHSPDVKVIYRDFKASNILLDGHYKQKFQILASKGGPSGGDST
ncbi:hypothetical protein C3L33_02307, partial [Rhododendron williamsianum]